MDRSAATQRIRAGVCYLPPVLRLFCRLMLRVFGASPSFLCASPAKYSVDKGLYTGFGAAILLQAHSRLRRVGKVRRLPGQWLPRAPLGARISVPPLPDCSRLNLPPIILWGHASSWVFHLIMVFGAVKPAAPLCVGERSSPSEDMHSIATTCRLTTPRRTMTRGPKMPPSFCAASS